MLNCTTPNLLSPPLLLFTTIKVFYIFYSINFDFDSFLFSLYVFTLSLFYVSFVDVLIVINLVVKLVVLVVPNVEI